MGLVALLFVSGVCPQNGTLVCRRDLSNDSEVLAKLKLVSRVSTAMYQTDPPRSPKEVLPTMYDLPSEDPEEPGLPDEFHDLPMWW